MGGSLSYRTNNHNVMMNEDPNSMQANMMQQQMMQKGGNMQNQQMIGQQYYSPRLQGSGVGTANPH